MQAIKRDPRDNPSVLCPSCGSECMYIGVKIPIPPKSKPKKWEELRRQLEAEEVSAVESYRASSVARKHELEKEIQKLEHLAPNNGRLSLIKKLRRELESFNA